MALHLVTLVGGEGWRTLAPMLEHYRALGADAFHVTLHDNSVDEEGRQAVLAITRSFGCGLYDTIRGNFADLQQDASAKPRRDYPRDWFLLADTDEFQRYPTDVAAVISECQNNEWEFVRGLMVDRVASDGGFPDLDPQRTLDQQFPLGCIATPVIQQSDCRKITLVRGAIIVVYGQHHAPFGTGCPRELILSRVDHFKWNSTAIENMRRRAVEFREQRRAHWYVSQNLVDYVDRHGGRFDLSDPALLAGPCDPEYSHWQEYQRQAFAAEDKSGPHYRPAPRKA